MNFALTPFDIAFPIGLGALFGMARFVRMQQASESNVLGKASLDALKGMLGAALIMVAYKSLGIL